MDFLLLGNHPFLDFINTQPVVQGEPIEQIGDGASFLNLLGRLELEELPSLRGVQASQMDPIAARAREMREDFRSLLIASRQSHGSPPDLAAVNQWIERLGDPSLRLTETGFSLSHVRQRNDPEMLWLAPLLLSGTDLLTSDQFKRVRKCANDQCVLWFVDTTKSGTRRWCSMSICGNVDKARTFRKRHQEP